MGAANKMLVGEVYIPASDKEALWTIPRGTKWFTIQCRAALDIRIAFTSGHVAKGGESPYFTLKAAQAWSERVDLVEPLEIFFGASSDTRVEVIYGVVKEEM